MIPSLNDDINLIPDHFLIAFLIMRLEFHERTENSEVLTYMLMNFNIYDRNI